jgi:subtilisin-like proprotein convertase family protein
MNFHEFFLCLQFIFKRKPMKKITLLTFLLLGTILSSYAQTFNSATGAIPDNSCTIAHEFPFTVTGVGVIGTTSSFDQIVINITHTYDSDLNIRLTAPTGEFVELSTNNGGSGDNYVNTVFRADATASITSGTAPFTGVYLPEGSFNAFNGVNADGTWILRICDQALTDVGTLNSSTMTFVPITPETPDYVNLQSPATATTTVGGPDVTIYAQVYEAGLTDVAPNIVGQAPGITAWIGYSTTDTNPDTWTDWIPATWNAASSINPNNDEYQIGLGATLPVGTYYYASRFKLNAGVYVYGGMGNFWNAATNPSGVFTVTPLANDNFANASTVTCGNVYTGNTTNATLDEDNAPDGFGADMDARNVWYKYTGTGSAETVTLNLCGSGYDTSVLVYTGTSGNLALVAANDDDNTCTSNGLNSKVSFNSDGTTTY